ncbi:MAG TPA: M13 family metallopeptidase, partial [Bryobacteraceae bacterium]|nr:M13 family metallopeptidase [Bryobacteraceae bacterium]
MNRLRSLLLLCLLPAAALAAGGIDRDAMNPLADPCVNFYQYACGNWLASHPIPADRARWGRFDELTDRNEKLLLDILQTAAASHASPGSPDQKIGDYFASCLDTAAIDRKGAGPVRPELDRIADMRGMEDLAAEIARLHRQGIPAVFLFLSEADPKDSTRMIAALGQGGLSLPDRDYYLKTDAKSVETREKFEQHVRNMFALAGEPVDAAAARAKAVLELETLLAKGSLDRVSRRDPDKTYHLMSKTELAKLAPAFPWTAYWKKIDSPQFAELDVEWPDFVKGMPVSEPMDTWKAYLSYHVLHSAAPELSEQIEKEDFEFWGNYLQGVQEQRPRANRCLRLVDAHLGDLLGQKYIQAAFGAQAKARITELVAALENSMEQDIGAVDWMSPQTKRAALAKLHGITNNVGYPKKFRDYGKVGITRDDFYGDTQRAAAAAYERSLKKIGKATDKSEWGMTTPTVNAYYHPQFNSINFPAGILQPPFFDPQRDAAINFGAIGAVIGHEMTHGFDDQGRKFDAAGNLRDWWTAQDGQEFEKRAACTAEEYSGFTAVDDVKVNGRLTLGENTADNGGVRIALMALRDTLASQQENTGGYTPEQEFFLGYAQIWCENSTPARTRLQALTNPHSPGKYRVNGVVQNMPEFQKAFACRKGQPMVSTNACRVW